MAKDEDEVRDNRRTLRIDDELWDRLKEAAAKETERLGGDFTASGLVRKFCVEGLERLERRGK